MINRISKWAMGFNYFWALIAGIMVLFVCLSIFVDVFLRYFMGSASIWITEISSYLFLYIIFLGTAYAFDQGQHINVTFVFDRLGPRGKTVAQVMTNAFCMVYALVLIWQSSKLTWEAFSWDWRTPTILKFPYAIIYVVMIFGSALLFITIMLMTLRLLLAKNETVN